MIEFGPFSYDPEARLLYRGDDEIALPMRVLAVLESFLKRPGQIVQKGDILASAWDGAFVGEDSLTQAVSQLRQALGDDPQHPIYIQTIPRRGYRFIAEVSRALQAEPSAPGEPVRQPETSEDHSDAAISADVPAGDGETLAPGSRLRRYVVLDRVGTGAMGEVWRAHDHELDREVALKLVPTELASDPEAMERFRREARMLAAVDHPNVAAIHTVEEIHGTRFIVMELVAGRTLRDLLEDGPLPVEESLRYALQIAEGLEAAHRRGVVHRDLKPANVAVTGEGQIKLLDFGLAKEVRSGDGDETSGPTSVTETGSLLGTAPYMSPEQARGHDVDERTDIWAFGCLLYEMLTAKAVFAAGSRTDTLAAILTREPDWDALPKAMPPGLGVLLRRCLEKKAARRLHHIADARIEIEDAVGSEAEGAAEGVGRARTATSGALRGPARPLRALIIVVVVLAAGVVLGHLLSGQTAEVPIAPALEFVDQLPDGQRLVHGPPAQIAISQDGRRFVYVATDGATQWLVFRDLGEAEARRIQGTEGASNPFLSPSGDEVAFFAFGHIRKVPVTGGRVEQVTTDERLDLTGVNGSWGDDGTIVLAGYERRLATVPASGGPLTFITDVSDEGGSPGAHVHPHVLPGGHKVLFAEVGRAGARLFGMDLRTAERRVILEDVGLAWYVDEGFLVYMQGATLMAVEFDPGALETRGEPFVLETDIAGDWVYYGASVDVSRSGAVIFVRADAARPRRRLVRRSRDGQEIALTDRPRGWTAARLSPESGDRLALIREELHEILSWVTETDTFSPSPITLGTSQRSDRSTGGDGATTGVGLPGSEDGSTPPVVHTIWHPSGERLTAAGWGVDGFGVYSVPLDGSASAELLFEPPAPGVFVPICWSDDGGFLVLNRWRPGIGWDIWVLDREEESPRRFSEGSTTSGGTLSPGGDWIAYESWESGRWEVLVQPFPEGGFPQAVTSGGGQWPLWSPRGDEIFFVRGNRLMSARVRLDAGFSLGEITEVFSGPYLYHHMGGIVAYDVAPDGDSFVLIERDAEPKPTALAYSRRRFWERGER